MAADRKIAGIAGFLFCGLVLILLLILYYPDPGFDDDFDKPPEITIKSWNNFESTEPPQPDINIAGVAKVLEDMGASFLALVAVVCIAIGLACLVCACCCVA